MWQDSGIYFDMPLSNIQMGLGEKIMDKLDSIEDTKGNAGDHGQLIITNLRIIWFSVAFPRINLGIGYNAIIDITTKTINSAQGHPCAVLYLLTIYQNSRYEFIFTNHKNKSARHCTSVIGIYRAYNSTKLYREVKLRGGFIQNKRLNILPKEVVNSTTHGVWNLSTEQGNVGTFIVTNIRTVWFADMNNQFNVSIPYLAINNISIKPSKFGPTLVIISKESQNGYILGFRVDPVEKLDILLKEISALKAAYDKQPILGVEYTSNSESQTSETVKPEYSWDVQENYEILPTAFNLYSTDNENVKKKPTYDPCLGLAIEELREGFSTSKSWSSLFNI
ncbi:Bardet-Biedl syndrome 5 protein homolog [Chelonus insularis]|uniref:Bardet-Biedl syndrome 5 protein homolog n=1 Tax=Chelonus insularis TaxID=460826 RepID=UPI00158F0B98|nr:Bardet-Biedl syndrome 5 protein homolog [Chelonus insularis]